MIFYFLFFFSDFHDLPGLQVKVNKFLQDVLIYSIDNIDCDVRELYAIIARILTPTLCFYVLPENKWKEQEPYSAAKKRACPDEKDVVKYAEYKVSYYFLLFYYFFLIFFIYLFI